MPVTARRLLAVLAVAVGTAGAWAAVLRGSDDGAEGERPALGVSKPVAALAAGLDAGERADQVILAGFEGREASSEIVELVRDHDVGGIALAAGNYSDPDQLRGLVRVLRTVALTSGGGDEARIPPLIVTSQQGGTRRALPGLPPERGQPEIGATRSAVEAERWAAEAGTALAAAGIDLNLFPVADVATLDSPVAGSAFSDDPAIAAELTAAAVRGCRDAGIACAPLHFPGLGAASQHTDDGPATVSLDAAGLAGRDLTAFAAAFAERAEAVVLSHALYAAYDPVTPGSLAAPVATGLLRERLGFEGVAITDELTAGAITAGSTVAAAAIEAIGAGADLLWLDSPGRARAVRAALVDAVGSGAIEAGRLAEAAGRVLELKRARGLFRVR